MSEQENVKVVEAIIDMVATNRLDRTPEFFHDDYFADVPGAEGQLNRDQAAQWTQNFLDAFPDLQFDIQRIIAQGDDVVVRCSASGTNTAPLKLATGATLPATGKPMKLSMCYAYTLRDGKVIHAQGYMDMADLLSQLGLMPAIEGAREVGA
jgi:steroid delta-isomerase-like uncharacterized protein